MTYVRRNVHEKSIQNSLPSSSPSYSFSVLSFSRARDACHRAILRTHAALFSLSLIIRLYKISHKHTKRIYTHCRISVSNSYLACGTGIWLTIECTYCFYSRCRVRRTLSFRDYGLLSCFSRRQLTGCQTSFVTQFPRTSEQLIVGEIKRALRKLRVTYVCTYVRTYT